MPDTSRTLAMILAVCILAVAAPGTRIIEGHVVDAATGAGIAGVRVRIFPADSTPANGYSTTTDSQGRFRLEGVEEGAYRATYSAPGFKSLPDPGSRPPAFAVAGGGEPLRLEIKLEPMGRISGRVLDAGGRPVPDAGLWLVAQDKWCMPPACHPDHRQMKADAQGSFTFTDLVPGAWLVSATAPRSWNPPESLDNERLGWAQTFYPDVIDPQLAEAVVVRPGNEQWSIDIKLTAVPVHRIRGRVLDLRGDPVARASVSLGKGFGPSLVADTKSDGTFEFASAEDDEWRLSAVVDKASVNLRGMQVIELRKHDLENIDLRLSAPFSLRGKVIMEVPEGTPAPETPPIDIGLLSVAALLSDGPGGFLPVESDGNELTVRDVYPGPYQVEFLTESPVPYFLDSIRLGDQNALGTVSILSNALPLTITYKLGGGTVRGAVEGCGSGHVFLVPQDPALRRRGFIRITTCDRNGRFEIPTVRPGEYYGLATAAAPQSRWFVALSDERVLKQAGKVTVRANESTSAGIRLSVW